MLQPRASGASESEDAEGGSTVFGNVRCFCFYSLLESVRNPLKSAEAPSGNGCRKLGGSLHLEEQPSSPENAWIQGFNHMSSIGFSQCAGTEEELNAAVVPEHRNNHSRACRVECRGGGGDY